MRSLLDAPEHRQTAVVESPFVAPLISGIAEEVRAIVAEITTFGTWECGDEIFIVDDLSADKAEVGQIVAQLKERFPGLPLDADALRSIRTVGDLIAAVKLHVFSTVTMDRTVAAWARRDAVPDGDLVLCRSRGVAWQADMTITTSYDQAYFDKYRSYEGQPVADALNEGRVALVERHYGSGPIVDVGIGSGDFVRARGGLTFGYDINPSAEACLRRAGRWESDLGLFEAATFWDVIEHVPNPDVYLDAMPWGAYGFFAVPVFADLSRIRESRHYRPGEHLYYWTRQGFIWWLQAKGFVHLETSWHEIVAGRDSIAAFAFRKGY